MKTATQRLEAINAALARGRTIIVATHLVAYKVTPKTAAKFAADHPVFKVSGESLYMARGLHYDCIDHAHLAAQ
jgi:DNA-binding transcriptional LysR family regulator